MSRGFYDQHGTWIPMADQPPPADLRCPFCDAAVTDEGTQVVCRGCGASAPVEGDRR